MASKSLLAVLGLVGVLVLNLNEVHAKPVHFSDSACSETSKLVLKACKKSAIEAYNLALGKCENVAENEENACKKNGQDRPERCAH